MNQEYLQIDRGEIVGLRPRRYKRILWIMVGIATAMVAMLLASPEADADANSYIVQLVNAGYDGPVDVWMRIGYAVCKSQQLGYSNSDIAAQIVANTGEGIYTPEAHEIIAIANVELCTPYGSSRLV